MDQYETAIAQVKDGCITIAEDGSVWRIATRKRGVKRAIPHPRRIDSKNEMGYMTFGLRVGDSTSSVVVHKLVYLLEHGAIPNGYAIDHRDGNRLNNRVANLEAVSQSENARRRHNVGCVPQKSADGVFSFSSPQLALF